jgi:hypothetical protein
VAWHQEVHDLDAAIAAHGGLARFCNSDEYLVEPADTVLSTFDHLGHQVIIYIFILILIELIQVVI